MSALESIENKVTELGLKMQSLLYHILEMGLEGSWIMILNPKGVKTQVPFFCGGGGSWNVILSPKLVKTKAPIFLGRGVLDL